MTYDLRITYRNLTVGLDDDDVYCTIDGILIGSADEPTALRIELDRHITEHHPECPNPITPESVLAIIERMIRAAEIDQERSLARTADGLPFPAAVPTADLRTALNGNAYISDSGSLIINRPA